VSWTSTKASTEVTCDGYEERVLLPHFIGHLLPELHHRYVM
jgi:hypothetical protein